MHRKHMSNNVKNACQRGELWIRYVPEVGEYMRKKKKDELGMCQRRGNPCERGEIMDQVCARGKRTHAKKEKR